jgi:hypothetical protein
MKNVRNNVKGLPERPSVAKSRTFPYSGIQFPPHLICIVPYLHTIMIPLVKLKRVAENTIIDKAVLMSRVKQSRENGYSISVGEWIAGALGISVPIRNYICPVALSIIGPEYCLKPEVSSFIK